MLAMVSACYDAPAPEPSDTDGSGTDGVVPPPSSALISSPTAGRAYVSMVTAWDDRRAVTVRNRRNGARVNVLTVNGGFDPIAIDAESGDSLFLTVTRQSGDTATEYGLVPSVSEPRVVRTIPDQGMSNVPLDSAVAVVFSQPMDTLSLAGGIHLQHQGVDVAGTVLWDAVRGVVLTGRFLAADSLESSAAYDILVSPAAKSSGGVAAMRHLTSFTTTWAPSDLVSFALYPVQVQLATVAPADKAHMRVLALDNHRRELQTDGLVSFTSDNPAVAEVDSEGHVRGIAPGSAMIRSTLTIGRVTMTDSVVANVAAPDPAAIANLDLSGVYDYTGFVTDYSPGWGESATGNRLMAELTITQQPGADRVEGNFPPFLWIELGAGSYSYGSGSILGTVNAAGYVTLALAFLEEPDAHLRAEGIVMTRNLILGRYSLGSTSGIFTAVRR
ncbi:MAG TPA: Ig-like domain-containing protein [Gemmatimonadales bacterium]|nr:Ig-like domain-containing protein [Gemmatimonadales bacterium]